MEQLNRYYWLIQKDTLNDKLNRYIIKIIKVSMNNQMVSFNLSIKVSINRYI
jgi:hypothetical protein